MPYHKKIGPGTPALFVVLQDRSGSTPRALMAGMGVPINRAIASATNDCLRELVICASQRDGNLDMPLRVAVIRYNDGTVQPAFLGDLKGKRIVSIADLAHHPAGFADDDGIEIPFWVDDSADGSTPMAAAIRFAQKIVEEHIAAFPDTAAPVVVNISDGMPTDDGVASAAEGLRGVNCDDGATLLFNVHLSDASAQPILYPTSDTGLPDEHARLMFSLSSELPESMREAATRAGVSIEPGARVFIYNSDARELIRALRFGSIAAKAL